MRIRLLGQPGIVDSDGRLRELRGHQAWAVLARVLLAARPVARRDLAAELFPDTADPLGALRWCLAALRRAIGGECLLGDPIAPSLPAGVTVDVLSLADPAFDVVEAGELLEHLDIRAGAEFATWLLIERERIASEVHARLRQDAMRALSAGDLARAVRLAETAVRRRPLEEAGHILLVKALVLAGRPDAAARHVEATERDFLEQLGEKPTPALRSAARASISAPPRGVSRQRLVLTLMESGSAALAAGATEAGIDCLRRAAEEAGRLRDDALEARALGRLGGALVHAARGYDDEGGILLRQSVERARRAGDAGIAVSGLTELGYVEALAGRRPSAAQLLEEALAAAEAPDDEHLAGIHCIAAFNLVDWGRTAEGLARYDQALDCARREGGARREAWILGLGTWGQLAGGAPERAAEWGRLSLARCEEANWLSFRPFPRVLLAEAELRLGRAPLSLTGDLEDAYALSCLLADPCWEGASARAMGIALAAAGETDRAAGWFAKAREGCMRVTDPYAALLVSILADQLALAQATGDTAHAAALARELLVVAARTHADGHIATAVAALGGG